MIRFLFLSALMIGWIDATAFAGPGSSVQGVRIFLNQGNPGQAIQTAKRELSSPKLSEEDRLALLELIAEAEEFRTAASYFQSVAKAVAAIKTLIKEFPDEVDEAALLWKVAWLQWRSGSDKLALQTARAVKNRFHGSSYAVKAWLLTARIHIARKKYELARNDLLQHGIRVEQGSRGQLLGRVWIAVVDFEESLFDASYRALDEVYQLDPQMIETERRLFATYIKMLYQHDEAERAIAHAGTFLKQYVRGNDVAQIRLLRADMQSREIDADIDAIMKEYELISIAKAETTVGKKAFMRKMMLQYRDVKDYSRLKPVIIALKRIASQNQLSEVENESILHQARLWVRVVKNDPDAAPAQASVAALEDYVRAATSPHPKLSGQALSEGEDSFKAYVEKLISDNSWMQVVVTWERFPQLRPKDRDALKLQFGVAHALRMLMEYEQAEELLEQLYRLSSGSIWGHKVMLERAHLWLDRGDENGIKQVMEWLNNNEFTLYRPEMLLLVARMQLKQGDASAASQTIASVAEADISVEERGEYWRSRAEIAEQLSRWHVAASAWRVYAKASGADHLRALTGEADSMFRAGEYFKAETAYAAIPEENRDAKWRYRISISQINTGKRREAEDRLELLKSDEEAGVYASMAALALAERQASKLLEAYR